MIKLIFHLLLLTKKILQQLIKTEFLQIRVLYLIVIVFVVIKFLKQIFQKKRRKNILGIVNHVQFLENGMKIVNIMISI